MIQRLINSKDFVAFILTAVTGMALYFYIPFPKILSASSSATTLAFKIVRPARRFKRAYISLRIPESVVQKLHAQLHEKITRE